MSFRTTTFPLDREEQGHLYIYVVYIVCLSLGQTRIFIDFVPVRDILDFYRLCPYEGHGQFIEFVPVP